MLIRIFFRLSFLFLFLSSVPAHSAVFNISSGDVAGLIAAIDTANSTPEPDVINLARGTYTLTRPSASVPGGFGGLPSITTDLTINGDDPATTIIERDPTTFFRILTVADTGKLTLNNLTVRDGVDSASGGAIFNGGSLTIHGSVIENNRSTGVGGGIFNSGTLILSDSSVAKNGAFAAGGGILNVGTAKITRSSIVGNGSAHDGGGIANDGTLLIEASTIEGNSGENGGGILNGWPFFSPSTATLTIANTTITDNVGRIRGAGIANAAKLKIINSTIVSNRATRLGPLSASGGGIATISESVELQNTIVALNTTIEDSRGIRGAGPDCVGPIASLGNNVMGDTSGCDIVLVAGDFTGDPGLGDFLDDGAPGRGRFPLLPDSPAIDAANDTACPPADQLGTPRRGACDIGAVEFYPVVNNLVALSNISSAFDPEAVPGGPAGTLRITAEFTNTSAQMIGHRFAEVVELAGENLLLNADGGAGGVGARLTIPDNASTLLLPGATETIEFIIGLQTHEPFTFLVNMLGDPQIFKQSVSVR